MTTAQTSEPYSIPGARLLLDQMVRLNDNLLVSVDQLRQKSRSYLNIGALAVTASAALLALSGDLPDRLWIGSVVSLVLFGLSAAAAVLAERTTALPDAPDVLDLAGLVNQPDTTWSDDQITLWLAREYIERIQPVADKNLERTARLVSAQMFLFLAEVAAVGGTLTVALAY